MREIVKKIIVVVTADRVETFTGKNLSASVEEYDYGESRLIIKKEYEIIIAMFNQWLYWRYVDGNEKNGED